MTCYCGASCRCKEQEREQLAMAREVAEMHEKELAAWEATEMPEWMPLPPGEDDPLYGTGPAMPAVHAQRMKNEHERRKETPIARGVLDYFPLAIQEVARVSKAGNDQHNPGLPMHWAREKSTDHADCIVRHLIDRGKFDSDGQRHTAKVAWRALALLQEELERVRDQSK
jgi:hypothetical protein